MNSIINTIQWQGLEDLLMERSSTYRLAFRRKCLAGDSTLEASAHNGSCGSRQNHPGDTQNRGS